MNDRMTKIPAILKKASMAALLVSLTACGGGDGGGGASENDGSDVNAYLREVRNWDEFSPTVEYQHGPTADPEADPEEYSQPDPEHANCKITPMSIQDNPDDIVLYNPNGQVMWLGNLISGDSYKNLGSFEQLNVHPEERAPLTISIDFLRGENFKTVSEPRLSSIQSAIGELVDEAQQAGLVTSTDASWNIVSAHSKEQVALELGFSARYLGSKASADFEFKKSSETNTVVAHFVQKLYTIYVDPPADGQGFFSDQFTEEGLQRLIDAGQVGADNPPVYISSVAYGRIMTYKMTGKFSESELRAAVDYSYNAAAVSGEVRAKAERVMSDSETRIELVALGGSEEAVLSMIASGNLRDYFTSETPLTSVRPIAYQMSSVKEPTHLASVANVTEYELKTCDITPPPAQPTGETVDVTLHNVYIKFDCDPGADPGDIWGWFKIDNTRVFNIPENKDKSVGSGNTLTLGQSATRSYTYYYGQNQLVRIRGTLTDNDSGFNGSDDTVGTWDFYINLETTNKSGTIRNKTGSNACGDDKPQLRYSVKHTGYVYD